jgi:hypothetical protein
MAPATSPVVEPSGLAAQDRRARGRDPRTGSRVRLPLELSAMSRPIAAHNGRGQASTGARSTPTTTRDRLYLSGRQWLCAFAASPSSRERGLQRRREPFLEGDQPDPQPSQRCLSKRNDAWFGDSEGSCRTLLGLVRLSAAMGRLIRRCGRGWRRRWLLGWCSAQVWPSDTAG